MANHHDNSYKLLFSHPQMVKDLLQGFVKEAWVERLDFSTLQKIRFFADQREATTWSISSKPL
ncbi:Rpn family recombination-promoting nuclease/putative transposase [Halomonas sp. NCCP-2165]|nr:Rpn family recombination-promoting nuclease/putative transposase [Halomonas sp. NCCP-2165]GKW50433.1 hypothetical protein NCCP2165_26480 [Halomonas sp. NCCP-2165]